MQRYEDNTQMPSATGKNKHWVDMRGTSLDTYLADVSCVPVTVLQYLFVSSCVLRHSSVACCSFSIKQCDTTEYIMTTCYGELFLKSNNVTRKTPSSVIVRHAHQYIGTSLPVIYHIGNSLCNNVTLGNTCTLVNTRYPSGSLTLLLIVRTCISACCLMFWV